MTDSWCRTPLHMSLEFYRSCRNPSEGSTYIRGLFPASKSGELELIPNNHTIVANRYVPPPPYTAPPSSQLPILAEDTVTISEIIHNSDAVTLVVLYSGNDAQTQWFRIIEAAAAYGFAEFPISGALKNWPNSIYQPLGNNSNTFIRSMTRAIGKNAQVGVLASLFHPGNEFPVPVSTSYFNPHYAH